MANVDKSIGAGGATAIQDGIYQAGFDMPTEDGYIEVELAADSEDAAQEALEDALEMADEVKEAEFRQNLAEKIDEKDLDALANELISNYDDDLNSRTEWEKMYKEGLELLGLKIDERTEPWDGACGVYHPMLSEAVVRFQAETITETFPASGPVKTQIIGRQTKEKEDAAMRVQNDMNWRLTEQMPEYRQEHERMLYNLPISGSAFKKVYFDPSLGRQTSVFLAAEDFVISYGLSDITTAQRYTHRMRKTENDIKKLQVAGFYRDVDLGDPERILDELTKEKDKLIGWSGNKDDRFEVLEMHVELDLPGYEDEDGIARPYVVTINKSNGKVLSIYRNWEMDDEWKKKRDYFVHYQYIVGFGFYGFGLIHLVGGHAKSATSLLRQLVDAGTLSNLPGGLKSRGLRIKGDDTPIAPGEWRDVDVPGGAIRDNILPLPYKEPSQVLAALLATIVEDGRRFASVADLKISDMSANAPVGTTLALIERSLKVMSAVQARVHAAMRQEFKLLKKIIAETTSDEYDYDVDPNRAVKEDDYEIVEILPVSDPNAATMAQRIMQYQAATQLSTQAPQIFDLPELYRDMLRTLGLKNADKIIPLKDAMKPKDPVAENMAVLMSKPVKAFAYQDHEAHIKVHTTAMQDPKLQMIIGQNPNAVMMQQAMQAHIAEHVAYAYRNELEKMLGVQLPDPEQDIPPEIEYQLSSVVAQAADKLLAKDQNEMAKQQAMQQAQDPLIQMQQQELQLKSQELQLKAKMHEDTMQVRLIEQQVKKELEDARLKAQANVEGAKLGAKIAYDKDKLQTESRLAGTKLGVDIAKSKDQMRTQREVAAQNRQAQTFRKEKPKGE